jgi:hypothetical protein
MSFVQSAQNAEAVLYSIRVLALVLFVMKNRKSIRGSRIIAGDGAAGQ